MARVYSRQLAGGIQPAGVATVVYTCPVGVTAVVREVNMLPYAVAGCLFYCAITGLATIVGRPAVAAFQSQQFEGHVVLRAGQSLTVTAIGTPWEFIISGYELGP